MSNPSPDGVGFISVHMCKCVFVPVYMSMSENNRKVKFWLTFFECLIIQCLFVMPCVCVFIKMIYSSNEHHPAGQNIQLILSQNKFKTTSKTKAVSIK